MKQVLLTYVRADSDVLQRSVWNRLARWVAPASCDDLPTVLHAELFFPADNYYEGNQVRGTACGITFGGQVYFRERAYSTRDWVFRSLDLADGDYDKLRHWAHAQAGKPFDTWSFVMAPLFATNRTHAWFCSKLVGKGLLDNTHVSLTCSEMQHPQALYNAMYERTRPAMRPVDAKQLVLV